MMGVRAFVHVDPTSHVGRGFEPEPEACRKKIYDATALRKQAEYYDTIAKTDPRLPVDGRFRFRRAAKALRVMAAILDREGEAAVKKLEKL